MEQNDFVDIQEAVKSFIAGFTCGKSFTHPYLATSYGSISVLHDAPRTTGQTRMSEVVACDVEPEMVIDEARRHCAGRYALSSFYRVGSDLQDICARIRALDYRLIVREPLMVRNLAEFGAEPLSHNIRRVRTIEEAEAVKLADGHRQILPEHLESDDSNLRLYAAWDSQAVIGWVRSIRATPAANWVSNLFVSKERRREGIGTSLMSAMLADDCRYGVRRSVLLASKAGTHLYNRLGYVQIGTALVFLPCK